jgi:hypothetical protein
MLTLRDGDRAEVLVPTEDGKWILARYEDGTEYLIADHEVSAFTPAPPGPKRGERVVVVVHHVPESEEAEESYAATTLTGVPLGVSVEATDAATAGEALERLLGAL